MSDERVVRDEVTRFGQHWVEVMRMGARVEREAWVERIPVEALHLARWFERDEQGVGVWRLYLRWPAREMVRLEAWQAGELGVKEAAVWYIEEGQSLRNALENASACLWLARERLPGRCLAQALPAGAPGEVRLEDWPETVVKLETAVWAPKRFLVVF